MVQRFLTLLTLTLMINLISGNFEGQVLAEVLAEGDRIPIFSLKSVDGQEIDMAYHVGTQIIVLGLFHICKPCMSQAMELQVLLESDVGPLIKVVGINIAGDSKTSVTKYINKFPQKISFPYLLDPERIVEGLFVARFTPIVYIIDRAGRIRFRGSSVPAQVLRNEIKKIL